MPASPAPPHARSIEPPPGSAAARASALVVVALFVLLADPGGITHGASVPPRLGLLLPVDEPQAGTLRRGVQAALDAFNRTGTPPAELVVRGRAGQWGDDGDEAGRLVLDDLARVVLAPTGGTATHLVLQVAGRTRTPVICLCPDTSVTGAGIPWVVQVVPSTVEEATAILPWAADWVAVVPADRSGRERATDLRTAATRVARAGKLTVSEFVPGDTNRLGALLLASVLERQPAPPAGVLLWFDAATAARAAGLLRSRGYRGEIAVPRAARGRTLIDAAGVAAEGLLLADFAVEPSAGGDRAGGDPLPSWGTEPMLAAADATARAAYDAAGLALALLLRAGDGPVAARFPLTEAGGGVTGPWSFDRSGARRAMLSVVRWSGSQWVAAPRRGPG